MKEYKFFNSTIADAEGDFPLPTKKVVRLSFNGDNIAADFDISEGIAYELITKLASQLDKAKVLEAVAKGM